MQVGTPPASPGCSRSGWPARRVAFASVRQPNGT